MANAIHTRGGSLASIRKPGISRNKNTAPGNSTPRKLTTPKKKSLGLNDTGPPQFRQIRPRNRHHPPTPFFVSANKKRRFIAPVGRNMNPAASVPPDYLAKMTRLH